MFIITYLTALAGLQAAGSAAALRPFSPNSPPVTVITPRPTMVLTPSAALAAGLPEMRPGETILAAAEAAPSGSVRAVFVLPVRRAEKVGSRFFLNSEADYRDQRNLSVAIQPVAFRGMKARFGNDLKRALFGKNVRVAGLARRVRINFSSEGRPTGKYYYQTHVDVVDARQIAVD